MSGDGLQEELGMFKYHLYLPRSASPASGSVRGWMQACYLLPMLNEAWMMGHAKEGDWMETRRHNTLYCAPRLYSPLSLSPPPCLSLSWSPLPYLSLFPYICPLSSSHYCHILFPDFINPYSYLHYLQENQYWDVSKSIFVSFTLHLLIWIQYC